MKNCPISGPGVSGLWAGICLHTCSVLSSIAERRTIRSRVSFFLLVGRHVACFKWPDLRTTLRQMKTSSLLRSTLHRYAKNLMASLTLFRYDMPLISLWSALMFIVSNLSRKTINYNNNYEKTVQIKS